MKTIGLIGGTAWYSTAEYYRIINEAIQERLGSNHSARMIIYSLDFQEVLDLSSGEKWDELGDYLCRVSENLVRSGADCILLGANTLHLFADRVSQNVTVPVLHIADETAKAIMLTGITQVGLLGTRITMEESFFTQKLAEYGIETLIPEQEDRNSIHKIIYKELSKGIINSMSREYLFSVANMLLDDGAEGLVLGCTELPLLFKNDISTTPFFDTTEIHALAAVEFVLGRIE